MNSALYSDAGFEMIGEEVPKLYCVCDNKTLFKSEDIGELNNKIDQIVNLYYFGQTDKAFKRIHIFRLKDVDPTLVEKWYLMQYKDTLCHTEVVLKKTEVVATGDARLANLTVYKNSIVSDIIMTRKRLMDTKKRDLRSRYQNHRQENNGFLIPKAMLVDRLMKSYELPRILKRN